MKRIICLIMITLIPLSGGWAQFDCSGEGERVGNFETPTGESGTLKVTIGEDGKVVKVVFQIPCEQDAREFDLGQEPVYLSDGVVVDLNSGLTFTDFSCDGEGGIVGALSLGSICGGIFESNPTPITVQPGPAGGGEDDGDDGEDPNEPGDDDDDDEPGNPLEEGRRVPITNIRPVAQLLGVEVEVNPPSIDMSRVASGIADVSFTAKLVWSNDNIPKDFEHNPTNWNFLARNDNGEWDAWESESEWGTSMWNHFRMEVSQSPEAGDEGEVNDLKWNFAIDRSNLDRENIRNRQVPVRAVYRTEDGNPDSELDAVINLRLENQSALTPLATSTGPAERNVTYRRILE